MNFKVTITLDEQYYSEAYEELISLNKLNKWEPYLAGAMILVGFILYTFDNNDQLGFFPFIFIGVGIFEFIKAKTKKSKWLKERLDPALVGNQLEVEFREEFIRHSGPFSNGDIKWAGLKEIKKTCNGIILKPSRGISIYLPDKLFRSKDEIDFILSKHNSDL
jgi:hypothetical protein